MGYNVTGKIHVISEAQQVSERFRKREFVLLLEAESNYPQLVQFELQGDRCELADGLNVGEEVSVEFSLRGREWTSPQGDIKYFSSLVVWEIKSLSRSTEPSEQPPSEPASDLDW